MAETKEEIIKLFNSEPRLTKGNLQIIACAGSGKTEFISNRIAYLVYKNITKPENIVAFTFTEKAAEELKFRIRSKIRELIGHQPDIGDMYIGTIHSFCFELLKEYVPGFRGYDVLDEGKRYAFISSFQNELNYKKLLNWLKKHRGSKPYGITEQSWVINTFIRCMDIVKEEIINTKDVSKCQSFYEAMEIYNKKLHEKRFLDFSSMMYLAVERLKSDKTFLENVRKKYKYITVDEYQDINPIQEKFIKLLTGNDGNLCVVGDDDQSIYQWRGADIQNIITFKDRYKNVFSYKLETNYRSTDKIIELSNNLIKNNKERLDKSMKSSGKISEQGDIYKLNFKTQKEEIDFIVKRIKYLIGTEWIDKNNKKRGLAYSDIAIFFRSVKYEAKPYIEAFKKEKIPFTVSGVGGLFESKEIDIIFDIFSYLGNFKKIWRSDKAKGKVPDENKIYENAKEVFLISDKKRFLKSLKVLKKNIQSKNRVSLQILYAEILQLLGITNEKFHDDDNEVMMFNLGRLSQVISDYEGIRTYCTNKDIQRFCWFVIHYAKSSYDAGAGEDPTRVINAVQIMTLHATKGLGFPVVFMPNCILKKSNEASLEFLNPEKFDFNRYIGSEEDERRLFYVGMTRSKKFLYITTAYEPVAKKRTKQPSKYFKELDDKYCICKPIDDPTKRNKQTPEPSIEDYKFPTNYSELSDYIRCEYDYKMRYIYGFNPELVQAIGFGKQIHNILNMLHKKSQGTSKVPSEKEAKELLKKYFYLRYASNTQQEKFMESALKSILRYLSLWQNDFLLSLNTERPFEMDIGNALISGTVDLLKRRNANADVLEIIDFKTRNERKLQEELNLQVQLYTIAAREALNLNIEKAYIHYLYDNKHDRVEVLTTQNQLELAKKTISYAVDGITSRRFNRNPRNIKICNSCDWSKICPKKKKL